MLGCVSLRLPHPGQHPGLHRAAPASCSWACDCRTVPPVPRRVPDDGPAGPDAVLREHAAAYGELREEEVPAVPLHQLEPAAWPPHTEWGCPGPTTDGCASQGGGGQSVPVSLGRAICPQCLSWKSLVGGCVQWRRVGSSGQLRPVGTGPGGGGQAAGGRPGFQAPHISCTPGPMWAAKVAAVMLCLLIPPQGWEWVAKLRKPCFVKWHFKRAGVGGGGS